jgi:hypothetical protein
MIEMFDIILAFTLTVFALYILNAFLTNDNQNKD